MSVKIRISQLRALVREALEEAVASPELAADLDSALQGLQPVLKALEAAHQKAPTPESKVIIAGVHSDIFNAGAYIRKVKSGQTS